MKIDENKLRSKKLLEDFRHRLATSLTEIGSKNNIVYSTDPTTPIALLGVKTLLSSAPTMHCSSPTATKPMP